MVLEYLDIHMQKNTLQFIPHTILKNYLKMYPRLKSKAETTKLLKASTEENID